MTIENKNEVEIIIDEKKIQELQEQYDPEVRFRTTSVFAGWVTKILLLILTTYSYYTAGFGLPEDKTHRGFFLAICLGIVFLVFPIFTSKLKVVTKNSLLSPGGISLLDWALAVGVAISALYVPVVFHDLAYRVGNPNNTDIFLGTILLICSLEATRRSMGLPLVIIALSFVAYTIFGQYIPGALSHHGNTWGQFINHIYLTNEGIYGTALYVISTYVFHFVIFGVFATKVGLGQLFLDVASSVAGKYAGGPAKVSVFSSALFGTISGSSVANVVTCGSLTIPAMCRVGYRREFAGAVEATASTGGQITPPIMGAAAFLMIEFLGVPYKTIILAAIIPAFLHFYGVFLQVHFEAKHYGLRGLTKEEMPDLKKSFALRWPTLIPLLLVVGILISGKTPFLAAFIGITSCVLVGFTTNEEKNGINNILALFISHILLFLFGFYNFGGSTDLIRHILMAVTIGGIIGLNYAGIIKGKLSFKELIETMELGSKYGLAVGAAASSVGIIIGAVTLTGVGFKISFVINDFSTLVANNIITFLPFINEPAGIGLFVALVMTAIVCIIMGCGIPTTANYLIMVTVAAPTLVLLGLQPIVAHFFVFYYGILADVTPPVALAAYASSGISGGDPFRTGLVAARLAIASSLSPFIFAFAPALLLYTDGFTWLLFAESFSGALFGIFLLAIAFSRFFLVQVARWEQVLYITGGLLTIIPSHLYTMIGIIIVSPGIIKQILGYKNSRKLLRTA